MSKKKIKQIQILSSPYSALKQNLILKQNQKEDDALTTNASVISRDSIKDLQPNPEKPQKQYANGKNKQSKKLQQSKGLSASDIKKQKEKKTFSWPVYKKFFSYTANRWKLALVSLFCTLSSGFFTSIIPYQVGLILDSITIARQQQSPFTMQQLNQQILQLGYYIIFLGITTYARFRSVQLLQQNLSMDMKIDIYSKFMKNDMYFFQQYKSGQFVSRLGTDINQAKSAVSNNLTFLLRNIVTIVGNIIFLFIMSWKLTLTVMTILPFFWMVTIYYNKKFKPLVKQYQDVMAEMSAHITQKFSGIQLVKAYSTQDVQIQNYRKINQKAYDVAYKKDFVQGIFLTSSTFLPILSILIVLWYGGKLAVQGNAQLTPGQLTSFIMYCTYLANNTSAISSSYANIINGTSAVSKVFQMMNYQPQIQQNKGMETQIQGNITFQNVSFSYPNSPNIQIFKNLNFKINKGEYIAFVGQSGSGKSTIIKLIQKFYKITNGRILFNDTDSQHLNICSIRKKIGMVNQQSTIFSGTIQQNIAYGLDKYTEQQLYDAAGKSGCLDFILNQQMFPLGFKTILGQKGMNLSGGQRQRISIARALMRKPKIIIFDQATSALDANSQQMVQQSIQNLAMIQNNKITIIVIAHRLSTVMNANRILVMKNGELIEQGTHEELKQKKGYYYQLVEKQLQDS